MRHLAFSIICVQCTKDEQTVNPPTFDVEVDVLAAPPADGVGGLADVVAALAPVYALEDEGLVGEDDPRLHVLHNLLALYKCFM